MVMIDTEAAVAMARAKWELDNADSICKLHPPSGDVHALWVRERRRRQKVFLRAARAVAGDLIDARLHELGES